MKILPIRKNMIIYSILNKVNGKRYIGQTIKALDVRMNGSTGHFGRKSNSLISKAIRKYSAENFEITTIDSANNIDELNKKEEYYIKFYNCLKPNGYNLLPGGRNRTCHPDTKKKLSQSAINLHKNGYSVWNDGLTKETDQRIAKIAKKVSIANMGKKHKHHKKHTEEMNKQKSIRMMGKKRGPVSEERKIIQHFLMLGKNKGKTTWSKGKKLGPYSEERRAKMRKPHGPMSDEHKQNLRISLLGKNKGKKYNVGRKLIGIHHENLWAAA
jgi:group I intron endonuclease